MKLPTIVIKIGTNVITAKDGLLDVGIIKKIVEQVAILRQQNKKVILVTSGAMGAGRALIKPGKKLDPVSARQVLAAVGQIPLVDTYAKLFAQHDLLSAQVLATKEDFRDREHYLNMRQCFVALLESGVVPIVNENDVVSVSELMFTDNDELAGLVAALVDAERLIVLTSVDGLQDTNGNVLHTITQASDYTSLIRPDTSSFGRGGMETKCTMAMRLARLGVVTHLVNGQEPKNISRVLDGEAVGTTFRSKTAAPAIKRWLAHARGNEQGRVIINVCAVEAITVPDKATSLLPIGIVGVEGEFKKGDVIKIVDEKNRSLGYGRAEYGTAELKKVLGKKNQKELVHYNYLFLDV